MTGKTTGYHFRHKRRNKYHLRNNATTSIYSPSLSPDVRQNGPRGIPIATPGGIVHSASRHWGKRGDTKSNEYKSSWKQPQQHYKINHSQHAKDRKKTTKCNSTARHHHCKKQKRSTSTSATPNAADATYTTSLKITTRSCARLRDKQKTNKPEILMVPRKHHIKQGVTIATLSALKMNNDNNNDTVKCPYCLKTLSLTASKVLAEAYNEIKQKDKDYHGQVLNDQLRYADQNDDRPLACKIRRPVALMERYSFCQLHNIELVVKPHGINLGWPAVVEFDTFKERIACFKEELDMIIAKKVESSYRKMAVDAYNGMGQHQARSVFGRMSWFEKTLPGYYGIKGASVIQEHLAQMYLHSGKLGVDVTTPQTGMEYLQQVLIPEVGFRLIREDIIQKDSSKQSDPDIDDQAKSVMSESALFGHYLQPLDWHDSVSSDEE